MWTNAYGATSSSTAIAARGLRRRFRPLTESPQVVNTNSSPSSANHTGITCGWPPGPLVATLAVRLPWLRKARISSGVILRGVLASRLGTLTESRRPVTKVHLVTGRRGRNRAGAARSSGGTTVAFWRWRSLGGARRGLQLEHQVGAVDRSCGGEALSGRLEPAHDALEGRVPVTGHGFAPLGSRRRGRYGGAWRACSGGGACPPWSPLKRLPPPRRHLGEVDHRLRNAVE